jgi:NAD(P)-dependent dehydrogenase (short-subunit alcohol dehydrogenase family)
VDYIPPDLSGTVALVAGATRGAGRGIAVALGAAGATVWCTGRSTAGRRSEYDRPETIEETAGLVTAAGGRGTPVVCDHLDPSPAFVGRAVAELAADRDRARWSGRSTSSGELARVYGFPDRDGTQPDAWRYVVEVQDAGRPAGDEGYR